ncbi:MAG TPA: dihydroxy-acid dehydratase [Tissierellia bacterium]|jgi:dihydroxy-acid dehydratase|nr:dihydroxy-acid dehydratase [Tissierellia bacterium]
MSCKGKGNLQGIDNSFARSLFKSMGYSDDDLLDRPIIGIANSWNTLVPGHFNLNQISEFVKKGIYRGGGTAVEFGVIGACDGIANGHEGMKYILPSREIICNSIEIEARAHKLDALVMIGSCDKIIPGMLMAAARLNIPSIVVNGGPMIGGVVFDGRKSDATSVDEALGMVKAGSLSEESLKLLEDTSCPSCGSCAFLGTANTMGCLSEALGMSLTGSALIPATYAERLRVSFEAGLKICELVEKDIKPRDILTKEAILNGIKTVMAISGSTNAILHLSAIVYEAELDIDVLKEFKELNKITPQIAKVNPAAKWDMEDFYRAGGIPRVMDNLGDLLCRSVTTCTGKTLGENLAEYKYLYPANDEIIKTVDEPFEKTGGVAVLYGNLAPNSAVTKPGAFDKSLYHFRGKAKVFNSEEEANEAILAGKIEDGDVVVIRYEGPKGGPGMREMYKAMKYLYGMGLNKTTALITDGRFSGTNNGCFVGHISPEAAEGGPIAAIQDGDIIDINVEEGTINVLLSDEEIENRLKNVVIPDKEIPRGYLQVYSKLASSADKGAVIL